MTFDYSLAGIVTVGLLIYLTYALLRPERFERQRCRVFFPQNPARLRRDSGVVDLVCPPPAWSAMVQKVR